MKEEIEKLIHDAILKWVGKNYGTQEMEDPSWSVEALAEELAKHQHEFYWRQELEYLKEDVEHYAGEYNYKLDEKQMYAVADKIRNSEWYCSINPEDMEYYIKEELKKGEQNETI